MSQLLAQYFYKLQIRVLSGLLPVTLFDKISQLDWYRETLQSWSDLCVADQNQRVLEVGCAGGYLTEYLHRNGQQITGVDISQAMINRANSRSRDIDFQLADAGNLPFRDDEFDTVLCASLVNIVPEPEKIIEEMLRVCKRAGRVSFLYPVEGFNDADLQQLTQSLNISGFSAAALRVWHESAPKLNDDQVGAILKKFRLKSGPANYYLNGMVVSVSAKNLEIN